MLIGDIIRRAAMTTAWGDKTGVIIGDSEITFREVNEQANRLANALLDLGLQKGDRVGLLETNCIEYVIIYWAVAKAGGILVPVNYWYKPAEIEYVLGNSKVSFLFTGTGLNSKDLMEKVDPVKDKLPHITKYISLTENTPSYAVSYSDLMASSPSSEPEVDIKEDDTHLILYTSGTTGFPKGVMHHHRSYFLLTGVSVKEGGMEGNDIYLNVYPMFHMGGPVSILQTTYVGATLVILKEAQPDMILETIQEQRITSFTAVPTIWKRLLSWPGFDDYDLSSLRRAMGASDAMSKETLNEVMSRTSASSPQIYGLTEGGVITFLKAEDQVRKIGSSGKPNIMSEIKIVDTDDKELPAGEVGEITTRGELLMQGYWNNPEETANAMRNGWLHTGDLGWLDDEGYIYITGRIKDMLISGGENIFPAEIERVLLENPKIKEVAVVGIPHKDLVEAPIAIVVLEDGESMTEDEAIQYVGEYLAGLKKPRHVRFVDAMPKTDATQKIQKKVLREQYADLAS
jgi:acyl-CoA synthetase (AMP-forming)/AMP-acid ligase II